MESKADTEKESDPLGNVRNRHDLVPFWMSQYPTRVPVVEFIGHGKFYCFSNFYPMNPVPFTVPDSCWNRFISSNNPEQFERTTLVNFSEKSIMLSKAAAMGDGESYNRIRAADTPLHCKGLGRCVSPFNEEIWQSVLIEVAFETVYQKFKGLKALSEMKDDESLRKEYDILMSTGDALIAETNPGDRIWGIGRRGGHPDCQDPRKWSNGNVLGFALMKARDRLRMEG